MWKSQFGPGRFDRDPSDRRIRGVDPIPGPWVPFKAVSRMQPCARWVISHDADVQAPEPEEEEQARFPGSDADKGGSQDPQSASSTGAAAADGESRLEVGSVSEAHPESRVALGFGLPPSSRITRTRDIRSLLRRGERKKTSHLDVFFLSSGLSDSRVGLIVPKHGHSVVNRNRVKRRLREVARKDVLPRLREEGMTFDLLVRARREAYEANYQQFRRELLKVTEELCSG